jgi:ring-1,2-phenylacetyl-CoA epoxidase subunit PaaC
MLQFCGDTSFSAAAAKSIKEVTYHLRWSSEWVIRLGDGTAESSSRMSQALNELWPYTEEFFEHRHSGISKANQEFGVDPEVLKKQWLQKVQEVINEATLKLPESITDNALKAIGKNGNHTEHLGEILTEMQYLQRAYPNQVW